MFSNVTQPIQDELSAQSVLEYNFLRYIFARAALPEIADFTVPQFPVKIENKTYRIDYGIVGTRSKFAIELDGFVAHSQKSNFNNDRFRGNDLINDGWTLIRFSTENINTDPKRCIAQLQDTLGRDPFLKNYLLNEIVSELATFSNSDWEEICQQRKNVPNKPPATARLNRDDSFRRLKTEGTASLTVRKKMYLEWLKNPSNYTGYQEFNARNSNPSTGEITTNPQTDASFNNTPYTGKALPGSIPDDPGHSYFKRNLQGAERQGGKNRFLRNSQQGKNKSSSFALIVAGLIVVTICILVFGLILLPMLTSQPAPTGPQVTQPTTVPASGNPVTPKISLVDELRAQPCRVGQIKGSEAKVYYLPDQELYADTKVSVTCFNSEIEAEANGFSKGKP